MFVTFLINSDVIIKTCGSLEFFYVKNARRKISPLNPIQEMERMMPLKLLFFNINSNISIGT